VLIKLVAIHPCPSPQAVPLANAFLKSVVRETGVDVSLIDFFIGQDNTDNAVLLSAGNPLAIGFSMYVWNRDACIELSRQLRKILPEAIIFAGGPEATADSSGVLQDGTFDFVIVGEGETPFAELCSRLASGKKLSGIPGVVTAGMADNNPSTPVSNLDQIPSPYLTKILDLNLYSGILWQLSRGCSFTCDFCFDARGVHGVRRFSLERIEAELRHFAAAGVAQIFVLDSTFNQDAKRAKSILRMIKKIAPQIHFHFEVRSEFIDREMADLFAKITCSLQIGLQSADPLVLKQVGRSFQREDFSRRIALLNDSGAVFGFDLIYGLPGDTLNGFCDSMDYALSLYPNHLDIFPLAVLPGTRLANHGASLGLQWQTAPPYTLLGTEGFSSEDLATAGRLANACDIFFTRGKAVAWFNAVASFSQLIPSKFMMKFADWLIENNMEETSESDLSDDNIWEMQRVFLQQLFGSKSSKRFLPIIMDLVDYHHYYASALLAPQPQTTSVIKSKTKLTETVFCITSSTRIAHFNYEIQDILDCGAPNINLMFKNLAAIGSQAVIYPNAGYICTESLDAPFCSILEQMDGKATTGQVLNRTGISLDDAFDFLLFAQQEGIIVPT